MRRLRRALAEDAGCESPRALDTQGNALESDGQ